MIFISGVHGVGKSYFCDMVKAATGIESYSASTLITQKKHSGFAKDKLIPDIDDNQQYLLQAVNELKGSGQNFILDGHFCLLNATGDTVFDKHDLLIAQLTKFGFIKVGYNPNGEGVYLRSRSSVDYSDPYKSFPFINPDFQNAGYLCVNDF